MSTWAFPTKGGGTYELPAATLEEWIKRFPALDVKACLQDSLQWQRENGLKTKKGMRKHLLTWLEKEAGTGSSARAIAPAFAVAPARSTSRAGWVRDDAPPCPRCGNSNLTGKEPDERDDELAGAWTCFAEWLHPDKLPHSWHDDQEPDPFA